MRLDEGEAGAHRSPTRRFLRARFRHRARSAQAVALAMARAVRESNGSVAFRHGFESGFRPGREKPARGNHPTLVQKSSRRPRSHCDGDLCKCPGHCRLHMGSDETDSPHLPVLWFAVGCSDFDLETRVRQRVKSLLVP